MHHTSPIVRRGHGALILIVLIAIAIILLLYFGGGNSSYMNQVSSTRKAARNTAQDISTQQLSILIAQYRQEHNKLPASPADLDNDAAFRDPWGGQITFTFKTPRPGGPTTVTYHSDGPDGQPATEDDVNRTDTLPF
jgi:hypothetical protein